MNYLGKIFLRSFVKRFSVATAHRSLFCEIKIILEHIFANKQIVEVVVVAVQI